MLNIKIVELTKDNEKEYIDQVAKLEEIILEAMEKEGKSGQLFITGKEGISEYVNSDNNTVILAVTGKDKVQSAAYITQGQEPYTYNDITKYFKYGEGYKQYVKSTYKTKDEYRRDMLDIYKIKIQAYEYARKKIMSKHPEYKGNMKKFLEDEIKDNKFHEKSILREEVNKYMSEFIEKYAIEKNNSKILDLYEKFYWTTSDEIAEELKRPIESKNESISEYEEIITAQGEEYKNLLKAGTLKIHEEPKFDVQKYYTANTKNAVEIDTYLTNPNQRHAGAARILVYEGVKKHIKKHFDNPENKEIFLCSTLHRKNLSSKYVSEFFGLKDSLFVERRQGRDREVHIKRIGREEAEQYLEDMQDKLIVLYGYNPTGKKVSDSRKIDIIEEQVKYEKQEFQRLNKIRRTTKKYEGNIRDMTSKVHKIGRLRKRLQKIRSMQQDGGMNDGREI